MWGAHRADSYLLPSEMEMAKARNQLDAVLQCLLEKSHMDRLGSGSAWGSTRVGTVWTDSDCWREDLDGSLEAALLRWDVSWEDYLISSQARSLVP